MKKLKDKAKNPFNKVYWTLSGTAKKKWEEECSRVEKYIKSGERLANDYAAFWELILLEREALRTASPDYNSESNYHSSYYFAIGRFLDNMNNNVFPFLLKEAQKRSLELEEIESQR